MMMLYRLLSWATECRMVVAGWLWQFLGRPQIVRKMLNVVSRGLRAGAEENNIADPYRERQKLERSLVLTKGLREGKEKSMQLALQLKSFLTRSISSVSDKLEERTCPRWVTE